LGRANRNVIVRARTYVLAAGGIENPRLLLASNSLITTGLGNSNDLVGRFFMEHPHARGGRIVGAAVWNLLKAFSKRRSHDVEFSPLLAPSEQLQEKLGILNGAVTIAARPPEGGKRRLMKQAYLYAKHSMAPTRKGRGLWKTRRRLGRKVKQLIGPVRPWWSCVRGQWDLALVLRAEQSPNPDSRVTLGADVDAIGMRRVQLDWRMQGQDVQSAAALVDALDRQAAARGVGQVEPASWLRDQTQKWEFDDLVSDHPLGGYHHMGTTRMADDPRRGVTDGDGRVHGVDNLYVAGSSLFPTGGWANPTLTILALSLRTAEQILTRAK
jgi:choline dehydrogenase-like flavoprotein